MQTLAYIWAWVKKIFRLIKVNTHMFYLKSITHENITRMQKSWIFLVIIQIFTTSCAMVQMLILVKFCARGKTNVFFVNGLDSRVYLKIINHESIAWVQKFMNLTSCTRIPMLIIVNFLAVEKNHALFSKGVLAECYNSRNCSLKEKNHEIFCHNVNVHKFSIQQSSCK